jgi:hypothetical protein
MWSSPTWATAQTSAGKAVVLSKRPPIPVSRTTACAPLRAYHSAAIAVRVSK